ncbi:MAG: bifunctional phosphopantothenoylcysteine decarboxylase/phosphopantothenate--cysteine ligase CoaBC, partial [Gaiellaceae bacterium]
VIAPCTANTLAKLAHGIADNVLTEAALAHRGSILIAPAMNPRMWSHPATRANAETLRARGVVLAGPDEGETAEGELGVGRMLEPEEIVRAAEELLAGKSRLKGKRVLVSAGGTREPIDSVRFVGNRSSGRMGVALAAEAKRRGAHVTLLGANLAVPAPPGVEMVETPTAEDLEREALARAAEADVVVMAAAVADYRPPEALPTKRPKDRAAWTIELEPTTDVLAAIGASKHPGQVLVGFAADEGERGLARARAKLDQKNADVFVFNDIARADIGFDSHENEVTLITPGGERTVAKAPKDEIAAAILDEVERLIP